MKVNSRSTTVKCKVTPIRGGVKAPYQIIAISKKEKNKEGKAAEMVRSNCRLGKFPSWGFKVDILK